MLKPSLVGKMWARSLYRRLYNSHMYDWGSREWRKILREELHDEGSAVGFEEPEVQQMVASFFGELGREHKMRS